MYPLERAVKTLPYLAEELAHNFNEKLELRLAKNWDLYATSFDMDYLFLTDDAPNSQRYKRGYDFGNYPLGKTGSLTFNRSNIIDQIMFLGGKTRTPEREKKLEELIFKRIKIILNNERADLLSRIQQAINTRLTTDSSLPPCFTNACNAMMELVLRLYENEQLSLEESINVLKMTKNIIDNPAEYKNFLTEAKNHQIVAGGRLAAYMMLIVGWAAKIATVNHQGDAWIRLATEKLDYLASVEECADASALYSKRI